MSYATKSELLIMDCEEPENTYKIINSIKLEKSTGMVSIYCTQYVRALGKKSHKEITFHIENDEIGRELRDFFNYCYPKE